MLRDLGRRFGRTPEPVPPPAEPIVAPSATIRLVAYTDLAILHGTVALDADRLTDALNLADTVELADVEVEHLADGTSLSVPALQVARDDVAAVEASGPRGDPERRVRTQAHPVFIRSGPYEITGHVHAFAGADPIDSLRRRRPMIPLTAALIAFAVAGRPRRITADLLIVNRDLIDAIHGPPDATPPTAAPTPGQAATTTAGLAPAVPERRRRPRKPPTGVG